MIIIKGQNGSRQYVVKNAKSFRVARFKFKLKAIEHIHLPHYKGSTFRGAFGNVLKRICCSNREAESCRNCILKNTCPYAYIFETAQPTEDTKIKRLKDAPRPFILEPPLDPAIIVQKGERFSFGLVLIGRGINFLPYFLVTFKELGFVGIGVSGSILPQKNTQIAVNQSRNAGYKPEKITIYKNRGLKKRGQYLLEIVNAASFNGKEERIYSHENEMVRNADLSFTFYDLINLSEKKEINRCTLRFVTPARIKSKGTLGSEPDFYSIFSRLIERIQALSIFHCEKSLVIDHLAFKELAKNIETEKSSLRFRDWTRFSSRQKTKMNLGGYIGEITFKGNLNPFLPFLKMGEYVHVGKNPTFGLGQYKLMYECNKR